MDMLAHKFGVRFRVTPNRLRVSYWFKGVCGARAHCGRRWRAVSRAQSFGRSTLEFDPPTRSRMICTTASGVKGAHASRCDGLRPPWTPAAAEHVWRVRRTDRGRSGFVCLPCDPQGRSAPRQAKCRAHPGLEREPTNLEGELLVHPPRGEEVVQPSPSVPSNVRRRPPCPPPAITSWKH